MSSTTHNGWTITSAITQAREDVYISRHGRGWIGLEHDADAQAMRITHEMTWSSATEWRTAGRAAYALSLMGYENVWDISDTGTLSNRVAGALTKLAVTA